MNKDGKSAVSVARSSKIYNATDKTIMDLFSQFQLRPDPPPPALEGKFPGVGTLELSNPRDGGGGGRGQMPRPPSTLQHFSLSAQSNSAVLNILIKVRFVISSDVFLCNSARILIETSRRDDMRQFM